MRSHADRLGPWTWEQHENGLWLWEFGSLGFKYGQELNQEGSIGKGFQFSNDNEMLKIF